MEHELRPLLAENIDPDLNSGILYSYSNFRDKGSNKGQPSVATL